MDVHSRIYSKTIFALPVTRQSSKNMSYEVEKTGLYMLAPIIAIGFGAGLVGSMLGIGGGVFLVPLFSVVLGVPMRVAVATSLVAVVATAAAGATVYLRQGLTDLRLAILLELPTVVGAITGSLLAAILDQRALSLIFACIAFYTAWTMFRERPKGKGERAGTRSEVDGAPQAATVDSQAAGFADANASEGHDGTRSALRREYYDPGEGRVVTYQVERLPLGMAMSALGGVASGLLGIGGGIIKVPVMKVAMKVPMRVAVATSNFMVGITAAASASVYLAGGYVDPPIAASAALAVLAGASVGARLASRIDQRLLARGFAVVIVILAIRMLGQAL